MTKTTIALIMLGMAAAAGVGSAYLNLNTRANAAPPQVEVRTQTFAVEKMTCAACPITVKKAMSRVEGVRSVDVDFTAKTATVVYDPSVTSVEEIAAASTNAGYPAKAIGA